MLSLSSKYAIRTVLYLANNTDDSTKLGAKALADELKIPQPFLAKILQQLARNQVIGSTKGQKGGFFLLDEHRTANLLRIVEVIDGGDPFSECVLGLPDCGTANPCPVHEQALVSKQHLLEVFKEKNIQEISEQVAQNSLRLF